MQLTVRPRSSDPSDCTFELLANYRESGGHEQRHRKDHGSEPRPAVSLPPTTSTVSPTRSSAPRRTWLDRIKGRLERGWNVFVFDGRGQQSLLFERKIPFRHDWEVVLTPVVDLLVAWPDVDAEALLAYGISQGGYGLPRALAFEHRFRRCCRRRDQVAPPAPERQRLQPTHTPTNGRPHASRSTATPTVMKDRG